MHLHLLSSPLRPRPQSQTAVRASLERHRAAAESAFADLHASQKRLASRLRALLNALDALLRLSPPRPDPAHVEALRAAAGGARALQARLRGVAARLDRVEGTLADLRARGLLPPPPTTTTTAVDEREQEAHAVAN